MQLWSGLLSNNAAKVRIVLAEKGVSYETIEVPWTRERLWEPKPQGLWDANPRGQVPVLVDGALTLYDSTVINEYLEEKHPQPPLMPGETSQRAMCRLWEDEGDHNQAHVGVLISDVFLAEPGAPLGDAATRAMDSLREFYDRLDAQLGDRDYLVGEYSVADISVFMTVVFAVTLGVEITQDRLEAWYERMMARQVIAGEVQAIMAGVAAL